MALTVSSVPPQERTSYIIDQLEGERITIPGSKGVFRILASSQQTNGGIAVFSSGAVLSDAPGFHWHKEAHDVFLVTKGYLQLWNGDRCRIMGPGDFAYVPPGVVHNPLMLGPHTEILGLVAPGDWVDFFRHVAETYSGTILPETDDRDLRSILMQKMMAAKDRFDVQFERDYTPPEVADWLDSENTLPAPLQEYFLRANIGPRWLLGGVMSRPFILATQCSGKFAISSIESSSVYGKSPLARWFSFPTVDHCLCVQEGLLRFKLKSSGEQSWSEIREGQTLVIAAGEEFALAFGSRYVKVLSFTNGPGIEQVIQDAGQQASGVVLPDVVAHCEEEKLMAVCKGMGVHIESLQDS